MSTSNSVDTLRTLLRAVQSEQHSAFEAHNPLGVNMRSKGTSPGAEHAWRSPTKSKVRHVHDRAGALVGAVGCEFQRIIAARMVR